MPSLIATLGANIAPFLRSLDEAQGQSNKKGDDIGSALGGGLSKKLGALVSVAAIEQTIQRTIEYGSKINDLSLRLGISTDAVQQWDYALKQSGSSIDAATPFFEKLAISRDKALGGGADAAKFIATWQKFGVTMDQLKSGRTESDFGLNIAKAFQTGDPQALIGPLRELGGKSAGELVTAFREGLADAIKDAPLISPADLASLDRAGDAWGKLKAEFTSTVAPAVAGITETALGLINGARVLLAVPVGALMGVVDVLKNLSATDLFLPKLLKRLGVAAMSGAAEAVDAVSVQQGEQERADEARKERMKLRKHGALSRDDDDQAEAKKLAALDKQIAAEKRKTDLEGLSHAQKIAYLDEELDKLNKKAALETDSIKKKEMELEGAKLFNQKLGEQEKAKSESEKEFDKAQNRALKDGKDEFSPLGNNPFKTTSLQAIGGTLGHVGSLADPQLTVAKKSEQHLGEIRQHIKRMSLYEKAANMGAGWGDTEF